MVALDVQNIGHFLAVGKAGRIQHNQVKLFACTRGLMQIDGNIGADEAVLCFADAVEGKVAPRPVQIGVG